MNAREGVVFLSTLLGCALVAIFLAYPPVAFVDPGEYGNATVTVEDANGTELATVDVRLADTRDKRRVGLSKTESIEMGQGMLFVHPREGTYTYVMRDMDFPLDIIFIDAEGTITRIHHAPVPEEIPGGNGDFPGEGQYVLEVPRGWTNQTGVDVGDRVVIPEDVKP